MYFNAGDHEFFYATYAVFSFRYNMKQHIKTHRDRNMTPEEEAAYLPKGGRSCRSPRGGGNGRKRGGSGPKVGRGAGRRTPPEEPAEAAMTPEQAAVFEAMYQATVEHSRRRGRINTAGEAAPVDMTTDHLFSSPNGSLSSPARSRRPESRGDGSMSPEQTALLLQRSADAAAAAKQSNPFFDAA